MSEPRLPLCRHAGVEPGPGVGIDSILDLGVDGVVPPLGVALTTAEKTCTNDLDRVIPSYFTGLTGAMKKAHA